MPLAVKVYEEAWKQDDIAPESADAMFRLYKRVGKAHLFHAQVTECRRHAKEMRAHIKGLRRPPGIGEQEFALPPVAWERLKVANMKLWEQQPEKLFCWVYHNWHDFVCHNGRCPVCGRKES